MVEIIVIGVNVFLLCFLLGYFVGDMAEKMLANRKVKISEEIDTAKMSKEDAIAYKNDYLDRLASFERERTALLEEARGKAAVTEEKIVLEGREEAERIIARAEREADLKRAKLQDEVKHDMVKTASAIAAKLIAENFDTGKQKAYIQQMLDEMGESTWQN